MLSNCRRQGSLRRRCESSHSSDVKVGPHILIFAVQTKSLGVPKLETDLREINSKLQLANARSFSQDLKPLLRLVEDDERRASLQLRCNVLHPTVITNCCKRKICIRCVTVHHPEKSCSENTKHRVLEGKDQIRSCPKCGIALVKGDGCGSITCICGCRFQWQNARAIE